MARDYAKSGSKGKQRNTRGHKPAPRSASGSGWRLYIAGVLSGVFLSFMVYLTSLQPQATGEAENPPQAAAENTPPKPRFDFYTLLPEQTIEVDVEAPEVEPARDLGSPAAVSDRYVLQAGSFRQREDADRRRAQLLLLGLEPSVQESNGDSGRWFRVYLGPYDSRAEVNRARGLTAAQDIDTLLLKRGQP
tara:strand:- start:9536 stop:10108 length:573 start_codon:yes stop_codon:yes gene_type:complete